VSSKIKKIFAKKGISNVFISFFLLKCIDRIISFPKIQLLRVLLMRINCFNSKVKIIIQKCALKSWKIGRKGNKQKLSERIYGVIIDYRQTVTLK